ncbi:MAG: winged helix-turn-helix domain-containing protein [Aliiglaciecola sp.]|uniref:winged helix-turn-helix domain-containing protein n=1 Tax=Aliiglaciecola sp. TaxID=1872441 RepID=UPI0032979EA1
MIYRFNNIEVDLNKFELRSDKSPVLIEPKVFDLIVYLIQHRQRLVTREELFETVWDGREVSDTSLSNHIKSARKILGDNGNLQQVIKTVRSRGYQFIAPVNEVSQPSITEQNSQPPANRKMSHKTKISFTFIILLVTVIFLWKVNTSTTKENAPPYVLVLPLSVSSAHSVKWEPFADQITRELIQGLRKISGITIVPPPSSFAFKENKTRTHIKQKIPDVNYVLDGVINEDDAGNIRITVEFENLTNGQLLWDGDFDMQIGSTNRFNIQSEIASSVSDALKVIVLENEKQTLVKVPTNNVQAYDLYVQGQYQLSLMTHASVLRAIDYFSEAISIDQNFEAAYIAKANAYRVIMTFFEQPKKVLPKVISSAIEVLNINPESAQIMSQLGLAYVHAWQWQDAWNMLTKAQAKDPSIALTELGFALYHSAMGNVDGVKSALLKADRLDPLNLEIADWGLWALLMVNEVDAAIVWGTDKVKLHPSLPYPLLNLSVAEYINGNSQKSITLAKQGVQLSNRASLPLILLAQSYASAGQEVEAMALINEAQASNEYMCPYETAIVHVLLDNIDEAFELFNQAVAYQSNCLIFTRNDPRLQGLKKDVRYKALLTTIGLDDPIVLQYPK